MLSLWFRFCSCADVLASLDRDSLLTERDQLRASLNQTRSELLWVAAERDELRRRYEALNQSCSETELERDRLKNRLKNCLAGWCLC